MFSAFSLFPLFLELFNSSSGGHNWIFQWHFNNFLDDSVLKIVVNGAYGVRLTDFEYVLYIDRMCWMLNLTVYSI